MPYLRRLLARALLPLFALLAATVAQAADVILRLEPKPDATIVAHIDATSAIARSASPVLDTQAAALGWRWTEYTTTLDGYVPTKQVTKNFNIPANTYVRAAPSNGARVLMRIAVGDQFEVTASNDQWTTIRFRKAIPVYFIKRKGTITRDQPRHAPQPKPNPLRHFDPYKDTAHIAPNDLRPENARWFKAPAGTNLPAIKKQPPEANAPQSILIFSTEIEASEIPQTPALDFDEQAATSTLSGTLVREITDIGPHYPLRLKSTSGHRLAYIDMSQIFINDLRPYLNKPVYIQGDLRPLLPGSPERIIQARNIRLVTE